MLLPLLLAATLRFDFPAVHVGVAEYDEGPTGATVFYFPEGAKVAVDVRGGAPATLDTDGLRLAYEEPYVDAISFAGGSSYGLAAGTGVSHELKARKASSGDWGSIASVSGAIIFDLGPRRYNTVVPDFDLGRAALRAARPNLFPLGPRGAGRFAMQGGFYGDAARQHSGQGGAFRQVGRMKVAVFTVVNSLGVVVDRDGNLVRCPEPPCGRISDRLQRTIGTVNDDVRPTENTTLTLVVTNKKLEFWALQRLAVQVHTSMARAIQPFHTTRDGDVLFAATTGEIDNDVSVAELGVVASELAWDAVLSSVPEPDPVDPRPVVSLDESTLQKLTGRYDFAPGATAVISREGNQLYVEASKGSLYLPEKERVALDALTATDFRVRTRRRSLLRFEERALTLNPGRWPVRAVKVEGLRPAAAR